MLPVEVYRGPTRAHLEIQPRQRQAVEVRSLSSAHLHTDGGRHLVVQRMFHSLRASPVMVGPSPRPCCTLRSPVSPLTS